MPFLWFRDIFSGNPQLTVHRFLRVVFGLICSLFLLNATVKHHASKHMHISQNGSTSLTNFLVICMWKTRLPDLIRFLQLMIFT